MRKNVHLLVTATAILLSLSGCIRTSSTYTSELTGTFEEVPPFARLPVKVGVYYSPTFSAYQYRFTFKEQLDEYVIPLGRPSVRLFNQILPRMFGKVVNLRSRPPLPAAESDLDFILEPRIEEFDIGIYSISFQKPPTEIIYRMTLYSTDGTPFASWTVTGSATRMPGLFERQHVHYGKVSDLAAMDGVAKFMTEFRDVPEVRARLQRLGVTARQ